MKAYADQKRYVKQIEINIGETVLMKRPPHLKTKLTIATYEETPMKIVQKQRA